MSTTHHKFRIVGPMVNTGINVSAGDRLVFSCVGYIDQGMRVLSQIRVDGSGLAENGRLNNDKPADANYPLPGETRYALIGAIVSPGGGPIKPFLIGKGLITIVAPATGTLVLGSNDDKPADNTPVPGGYLQTPWQVSVDHKVPDPPAPSGTPDLRIDDIQILQVAAPSGSGDSVLVSGKTTVVRAFLSVANPLPPGTMVNGFVEVNGIQFNALNPTGSSDGVVVLLKGSVINANQTSASLNFEVPGSLLGPVDNERSSFTFTVTAFVGRTFPGNERHGFVATDGTTAAFSKGQMLPISMLSISAPITGRFDTPVDPTSDLINLSMLEVEARLPVPDGGINIIPSMPRALTVEISINGTGGYEEVANRVNFLRFFNLIHPDLITGGIVLGVVPPHTSGFVGVTILSTVILGLFKNENKIANNRGANTTAAHELGHICEMNHAGGCGSPKDVDSSLPRTSGAPGWNTLTHQVVPMNTPALMSYCEMRWPTSEEYVRMYRSIRGSYAI